MKTILKSMVALSLVSSVAMGAKIWDMKKNQELNVKIEKNSDFEESLLKFKYSDDKENILVTLKNGETAIVESMLVDEYGYCFLYVIKDDKLGEVVCSNGNYYEAATAKFAYVSQKSRYLDLLDRLKNGEEFDEYYYDSLSSEVGKNEKKLLDKLKKGKELNANEKKLFDKLRKSKELSPSEKEYFDKYKKQFSEYSE